MNQKSHKIHQSNSSGGPARERKRSNHYLEIEKQSYSNMVPHKYRNEDAYSPRGRKAVTSSNYKSSMNKVKSSTYRNSSSKSTYRFSDRRKNHKHNSYNSDSILSDHEAVANLSSKLSTTQITATQNCFSEDLSNQSVEYASPDTIAEKASCNCSTCRQVKSVSENSEEQSLSKEIYQIIWDIYQAHIKNQEIKETVRRYQLSVHEFCIKESQGDIIYLVKLFTKMLSNALIVSQTNNIYRT